MSPFKRKRNCYMVLELIELVDEIIETENRKTEPNNKLLKEELQRENVKKMFDDIRVARKNGDATALAGALETFFEFEKTAPRLEVLKDSTFEEVVAKKRELLCELRMSNIHILEKGAIEAYYPLEVTGRDKPSKAQSFCSNVKTKEQICALCDEIETLDGNHPEFNLIFLSIFNGATVY